MLFHKEPFACAKSQSTDERHPHLNMFSRVHFFSLPVTDQARALKFWRDVAGLKVVCDADYLPGNRWIMLGVGDSKTRIHLDLVDNVPESSKPVIPLVTPDVHATVKQLRDKGTTIVQEPSKAPWNAECTIASFKDSEGNLILVQDLTL